MNIGVAQIPNTSSHETNLANIVEALKTHSEQGSELVIFPECALSGYSPALLKCEAELLANLLASVKDTCKRNSIAALVPTLTFRGKDRLNSVVLISEAGEELERFFKIGFTPTDEKIFSQVEHHSRSFNFKGFNIGVLICAEISDDPWKYLDRDTKYDAIVWPGMWGWRDDLDWKDPKPSNGLEIIESVSSWETCLIQANFSETEGMPYPAGFGGGRSFVINKDKSIAIEGPKNKQANLFLSLSKHGCQQR